MQDQQQTQADPTPAVPGTARKLARAILFFIGSAAFGGLAVALWDRKSLTAIRRKELELEGSGDVDPSKDEELF